MIALDAMGGDFSPEQAIKGSIAAAKKGAEVVLFGDEDILSNILNNLEPSWQKLPISLSNCSQKISMAENPVKAIKSKKDSSIVRSLSAVSNGECRVAISAGNSGALMIGSIFLIGRDVLVDGAEEVLIERPALAGFLPVSKKSVLCLDLGANADCKPYNLYQFAIMGDQFFRKNFLGCSPKIGLLSNGREDEKGSSLTKNAFSMIKKANLDFVGNVEPLHVLSGEVDVLVCDGFSGNVFLKTFEATRGSVGKGAMLLGAKKPVLVMHGDSDCKSFERTILFADEIAKKY